MAALDVVNVREPAVAGMFYPADSRECRLAARSLLKANEKHRGSWLGAIVPHAGWICSGAIAGEAIETLRQRAVARPVDLVVVFGAIHTPLEIDRAALDVHHRWAVPGGESHIARDIQDVLSIDSPGLFCTDERFHKSEHAVEVELPLIREAFGEDVQILPVEVPVDPKAIEIGRAIAKHVARANRSAVFLASSDLTHYGPSYHFAPHGVGIEGLNWARENDKRLLEIVTNMSVERVVPEVRAHQNACGPGAIAAMLAACREMGARSATVLRHASSYETLANVAPQRPDNAVGYAAVVVQ